MWNKTHIHPTCIDVSTETHHKVNSSYLSDIKGAPGFFHFSVLSDLFKKKNNKYVFSILEKTNKIICKIEKEKTMMLLLERHPKRVSHSVWSCNSFTRTQTNSPKGSV